MTWRPISEFNPEEFEREPADVWCLTPFPHRVPDAWWHEHPDDGGGPGFFVNPDVFARYFHKADGDGGEGLTRLDGVTHFMAGPAEPTETAANAA